jgi:hypothetical protein
MKDDMPRSELDGLYESMIKFAQDPLRADGEFRPFGATVDGKGQVQYCAAYDDSEKSDYRSEIRTLKQYLKEVSESGQIHAVGLCFDVILHREGEPSQEAIQCSLEHEDGDAFERLTPYSKTRPGVVVYGASSTADREREIFGLAGSVLTLESRTPIRCPTVKQLYGAVDSLTPRGGPGFLILDGAGQDYVQAAGGGGAFTAEWREYSQAEFKHWVAGLGEGTEEETVEIQTNGSVVTVHKNEVLATADVKSILAAFANGKGRPAGFMWRDITARFVGGSA